MAKTALVVSGGGSKGAFAVGAVEVMKARGIHFDLVIGTSTGALVAPLVATDDVPLLRTIYTTVHTEDILVLRRGIDILAGDAIHDTTPLWSLINKQLPDARYQRLLAAQMEVFVCVTNLQDGRACYFNPKRGQDAQPLSRDTFCRAVFASASEPVLMPPIRVPHEVGDQYVDGGVREVAPLRKAIDEGADKIYAIVLEPEQRARHDRSYVSVLDTLQRTLDIMLHEVARGDVADVVFYNDVLAHLGDVRQRAAAYIPADKLDEVFEARASVKRLLDKRPIELLVIRPDTPLPSAGLRFEPPVMSTMMDLGRKAAERALG